MVRRFALSLLPLAALFASISALAGPRPLPANWNSLSYLDKLQALAERVLEGRYDPSEMPSLTGINIILNLDVLLRPSLLRDTLTWEGDELPRNRKGIKLFHTYGSTFTGELIIDPESPYTGLLAPGVVVGIGRLSYAGNPTLIGNVPGLGLKFPITGTYSRDQVVMHGLDSQGDNTSVFLNAFSNILPQPSANNLIMQAINFFFERVTIPGQGLVQPLDHLTDVTQDGTRVADPVTPYQLVFWPSERNIYRRYTTRDFRNDLKRVEPNSELYDVYAAKNAGSPLVKIGRYRNTSKIVASKYGDKNLFIKHNAKFLRQNLMVELAACNGAEIIDPE